MHPYVSQKLLLELLDLLDDFAIIEGDGNELSNCQRIEKHKRKSCGLRPRKLKPFQLLRSIIQSIVN